MELSRHINFIATQLVSGIERRTLILLIPSLIHVYVCIQTTRIHLPDIERVTPIQRNVCMKYQTRNSEKLSFLLKIPNYSCYILT